MTSSATMTRPLGRIEEAGLAAALFAAVGQHWLWGAEPGAALALTFGLAGALAIWLNRAAPRPRLALAGVATLAAMAPLYEAASLLSVAVSLTLTALACLIAAGRAPTSPRAAALTLLALAPAPVWRLPRDLWRWRRAARRGGAASGGWRLWLTPLALGSVFIALLAMANPVIDDALARVSPDRLSVDAVARTLFTALLAAAVWPLLRPARALRIAPRTPRVGVEFGAESDWFGAPVVLRALALFNAIFAVQTTLDVMLLWGGGALPEGMSYAEYAHRGAYPLIATALLAAVFVLVALRPGSAAAETPLIRRLVYLWIAQNIALVVSSIYRLDLYVDVYGLTHLRVAAFIWMGLVAVGLALIVLRIAARRSGDWLIGANFATLGLTLYAACYVNFTDVIARHNAAKPERLDLYHLTTLGPHAIPAVDDLLRAQPLTHPERKFLRIWRAETKARLAANSGDWRGWNRRDAALSAYLDARPAAPHYVTEERS